MGTYVYAFNTKVNNISGVKLGVAEYRYKPAGWGGEEDNRKWHNQLVAPRVRAFNRNPSKMPEYFVHAHEGTDLKEGMKVYQRNFNKCWFYDSINYVPTGVLVKQGRGFEIQWNEGFPKETNKE